MKRLACLFAAAGVLAPVGAIAADCPPMSAYRVTSVSATDIPIGEALEILFAGTTWKPVVSGPADGVKVSFRGVSGPLDAVFTKVVEGAGRASPAAVSATTDASRCLATVTVKSQVPATTIALGNPASPAAPAAPAAPVNQSATLRSGSNLSDALAGYVKSRGWELKWLIDQDYVLDVDLPIPPLGVVDGVTWVVRAYQSQGGMQGVLPRFAKGNNVVVIEAMDVREATQ